MNITRNRHIRAVSFLFAVGFCALSCTAPKIAGDPGVTVPIPERLVIGREQSVSSPDGLGQRGPAIAFGNGVYLLAWREGFSGFQGKSRILALRFDEEGHPIEPRPFTVSSEAGLNDHPTVAFCAGHFLVAWNTRPVEDGDKASYGVNWRRVDTRGKCAPETGTITGAALKIKPALASNGKDTFMLVWQEYQNDCFSILGTRIESATGERIDPQALALMTRQGDEETSWSMAGPLGIAWTGAGYVVAQSVHAIFLDAQGTVRLPRTQLWDTDAPGGQTVVSAWDSGFVFHCACPDPDPWGWYGNGAIVGMHVTPDRAGSEWKKLADMAGDAGKPREYALLADGHLPSCLDAARWMNHPGWPMGIPGGLRHTVDDLWPSGSPAAAFNGESLMVIWPRGHRVDNRRLVNRDLYMTRLYPGWIPLDPTPIRIVCDPVEESNPVLCAGNRGRTLLAYEKLTDAGVAVRYRLLVEKTDRQAPRVESVSPLSREELIVRFDEPVLPESVVTDRFTIKDRHIIKAEFNRDARARGREVILTVEPPEIGRTYTLQIDGVTDCSPAANAMQKQAFPFLARPGTVQHCPRVYQWDNPNSSELNYVNPDRTGSRDYICNWLLLGPVPGGVENQHPFDPALVMPSPGDTVDTPDGPLAWTAQEGEAVDLSARMGKKSNHSAYAATYLFSEKPRNLLLRLDSNDHSRAWLNGRLVHDGIGTATGSRGFHEYTDTIPVHVDRGWNRLLLQVHNQYSWWMMVAQIVDLQGATVHSLTWQTERPGPFTQE